MQAFNALPRVNIDDISRFQPSSIDQHILDQTRGIITQVKERGDSALYEYIRTFEKRDPQKVVVSKDELEKSYLKLPHHVQSVLQRTALRIQTFAEAQLNCIRTMEIPIEGGVAGHDIAAIERVACYAPGGHFPLPSTILMTAVTAKVAGVTDITIVTPSNDDLMLGAAYIAGADSLIHAGGAQAIAAVTYGTESVDPVDMIVGPGNRWVTAAKSIVHGIVGIDMLAGPSELLVVADETACSKTIAADLLAQAEHDPCACPILVTQSERLVESVNCNIISQLKVLPTKKIAQQALLKGMAIICSSDEEIIEAVNRLAPEHLELIGKNAEKLSARIKHYGGLFIGHYSAEVFGDYGAGPNHTLPTGGTARFTGGLSVFNFLRIRTWMRINQPEQAQELMNDAHELAQLEGLMGHAHSAHIRQSCF